MLGGVEAYVIGKGKFITEIPVESAKTKPGGRTMSIREIIKTQMSAGLKRAVRDVLDELAIQRRHHSSLKRANRISPGSNLKLNIGCGPNAKTGWINIDLFSEAADLQLDLREDLPFPDESASVVYSEHFFEHLEYPGEAMKFLRESWRVLAPGGIFSAAVPDTEWPLKAYVDGDDDYFRLARERLHPKWCDTRMHHVNYHFRQGTEHKYAYDFETLARILGEVGFVSIARRSFNPGLDSESRKIGSLYVDARKPERA